MGGLIRRPERAIVAVGGAEAVGFLQGILTNAVDGLAEGQAVYAGLLTPQGKLLFDFFVLRHGERFLLDVARLQAADLVKRLTFYRLRAKVEIAALAEAMVVVDLEGAAAIPEGAVAFDDPRLAGAGRRVVLLPGATIEPTSLRDDDDAWLRHRIALALPEGGRDFAYGDCFPHDIAMDQLGGIAFSKGCYVGQEVVSRMRHRGTARRRPMIVRATAPLPPTPCDIVADGRTIGTLGSAAGPRGLAEIRLDFAEEVAATGKALVAAGVALTLHRPRWAHYGETFATIDG